MLTVIDYGAGNLRSVVHALTYLGATSMRIVREPDELKGATRIILPGVGAFGAGMEKLYAQGLVQPIKEAVHAGVPYLGICLGMQFLFETSDEMGQHNGLGLLPGRVTRFPERPGLKVPHMGWNNLHMARHSPLVEGLETGQSAYFVHSYYCEPADSSDILITTDYGAPFCSGVARGNLFGVQFHPEKSQQTGLRLLSNFLKMTERVEVVA
ncbi:MAG: imidazole glycerol phosphate synthase subunit HisH [Chloroflexi bacterium]|nr:imidazole glycerol phosphate synthase subunit HisH [Chloroflexota bacterium]